MQFSLILVRFRKTHNFHCKYILEGDLSPQFDRIIKLSVELLYGTLCSLRRGLKVDRSPQYRAKIE